MGKDLAEAWAVCRETFQEADDALSFPISRLCFEGPEADLTLTANTQPALLTASVAAARALASLGVAPAWTAGHSLGEYSALVTAGVIGFGDAVRAVRLRGTAMQEAVPQGEGAMAAILGLAPEAVEAVCRDAAEGRVVSPANYNAPEQTVIAGHADAVARASKLALERGASKAVPLAVSAPFHCSLMRPAEIRLAEHLASVSFQDPRVPVVVNVDATPITTGVAAKSALVRQVCSPVRWVESVRALRALGAFRFVEVGPGRVLGGLLRRIDRSAESASAGDRAGIESQAGPAAPAAPAAGGPAGPSAARREGNA
jgi:[acyl-carrier-protein] S-malonyltransferase